MYYVHHRYTKYTPAPQQLNSMAYTLQVVQFCIERCYRIDSIVKAIRTYVRVYVSMVYTADVVMLLYGVDAISCSSSH